MGKLYSFGCSFSDVIFKNNSIKTKNYPEHKLYTELLSDKLNLELVTNAYEGRGNNTILLDLSISDFEDDSIIVVQLTMSNRVELKKWINKSLPNWEITKPQVSPFTLATLNHFNEDKDIKNEHVGDYLNFITTFYDILCFNDLYHINEIIKIKNNKHKNCKFYVITALKINTNTFLGYEHLIDIVDINGIMNEKYKNWGKNDPHLSDKGNLSLFNDLYKII